MYRFAPYLDGKNYFSNKYLAEAIARWPEFKASYLLWHGCYETAYGEIFHDQVLTLLKDESNHNGIRWESQSHYVAEFDISVLHFSHGSYAGFGYHIHKTWTWMVDFQFRNLFPPFSSFSFLDLLLQWTFNLITEL